MIVVANKTEIRLRDDLNKYKKLKPGQRCFFMAFSQTDIPKKQLFETLLHTLEDVPNSYMACVYLCQDKDILILMEASCSASFWSL